MYTRLARWSFHHAWTMVGIWVAIVAGLVGLTAVLGTGYSDVFSAPESESASGFELMQEMFGDVGGEVPGSIVVYAPQGIDDPEVTAALQATVDDVRNKAAEGAPFDRLSVVSPFDPGFESQIAADGPKAGQIAYASLSAPLDLDQQDLITLGEYLREVSTENFADVDGAQVEIGGQNFAEFAPPETEVIGIAFAMVVLIIAMGSVIAMGATLGVAILGVATGMLGVGLVSNLTTVPTFATSLGIMIGLGVGIDYALFIVNRYREALRQGFDREGAIVVAIDTSGRAVIFAGLTVVVSLLGLLLIGLPFVSGMGISAASTVLAVMAGSVTLLPSVISLIGDRMSVNRRRGIIAAGLIALALLSVGLGYAPVGGIFALLAVVVVLASFLPPLRWLREPLPARDPVEHRSTVWYRWSRTVQARPWLWAILGSFVLLGMSAPVLSLDMGFSDEGNYPEETTTRKAYDLLAEGFGPGVNGPLLVVGRLDSPEQFPAVMQLTEAIASDPGVASAGMPGQGDGQGDAGGDQAAGAPDQVPPGFVIQIQPTTSPQDSATDELVNRLRNEVVSEAVGDSGLQPMVTGAAAINVDFTEYLTGRMVVFFGVVLALSFILLMMVFRSLLVPLKAVIMNMLSISAAYGVVIAVFQWGWLGSLFGIAPAPIEPFIPMMMFAILFGLSMDYEVFLLSRIKEEYERTGDAVNSVADGLALTARVITTAAAIMVVVFGSFMLEDERVIKLFGLGLASAIAIDATIVRMILVPSTMQLLGSKNWWLPRWLDKILPNLNVEGSHHTPGEPLD